MKKKLSASAMKNAGSMYIRTKSKITQMMKSDTGKPGCGENYVNN